MVPYKDIDVDSGVSAYEIGEDYIEVKFNGTSKIYTYSYKSAGSKNVEIMKELAEKGNGLNSFINKNVKFKYEK